MSSTSFFQFKKMTKLPIILQDETAECGHACVAMIGNFWGHDLDLHTLRKINKLCGQGVTLLELSHLFETLGLRARGIRVALDELKYVKTPAILHWNLNHFVVLNKVKRNSIVIHDPAIGVRKCSFDEASNLFTGIVLEVEKSEDFRKIKKTNNRLSLFNFIKTIHGVNKYISVLLSLTLSIEILSLLNPLFIQYVTDNVVSSSANNNLYVIASIFIVLILIQIFTDYIRANMVIYLTNSLTEQFSSNIVNHILKLPLEFFEKRSKGDIQAKFQSIDQIQKKIGTDSVNIILDGLMIIINLTVMLIYSRTLTLLVILSLLIYLAIRCLSWFSLKEQAQSSIALHVNASSVFLETLRGIIPVKTFLKESVRFNTWRNSYIKSLNADIKMAKINVLYNVANQGILHIEPIIITCIGALLVIKNEFSVGMLLAFLAYRHMLVNKTTSLIHNVTEFKLITLQLNRLEDILFQEPEVIGTGLGGVEEIKGALHLKNIFFSYHGKENFILNNVSLTISPSEKIVIIGPSGCGKSTLLKVMMGLLSSTAGEIFIDDTPLHNFGLKNYRNLTASVMQEDTLLSGSIIDNITFFDESINLENVYTVSKLACIHETIIKLPMAYETLVGEMGSTLSGGQKQRILLARALYKRPKLLFLDEATSHLDVDNERSINIALKSLKITQVVIAHRKETIEMADRVIDLGAI